MGGLGKEASWSDNHLQVKGGKEAYLLLDRV